MPRRCSDRTWKAFAAAAVLAALAVWLLWSQRETELDRAQAVPQGLRFIYSTAVQPKNFFEYGSDYLGCFYSISATSHVPPGASADDVADLAFGSLAADCLGVRDENLKREIRQAAGRYRPEDFLWFDPAKEPPPADVPEACPKCGRRWSFNS